MCYINVQLQIEDICGFTMKKAYLVNVLDGWMRTYLIQKLN